MIYTFDEPGWDLNSNADPSDATIGPVPGDSAALILKTLGIYGGNVIIYGALPITLAIGTNYAVRAMIDGDMADETTPLQILVNGAVENFARAIYKSEVGAGMQIIELGTFVPTETDLFLFAALYNGHIQDPPNPTSGRWVVGSISVADASIPEFIVLSKWAAVENAIAVLKGINGAASASYTNLGGRVYTELFDPIDDPERPLPYVCVPLVNDEETIEYESFMFTARWRLTIYGYFANDADDRLEASGARLAANFRDDVVRAFMLDQHLSGQTVNAEIVSVNSRAGVLGLPFAETEMTLAFTQIGSADDLAAA
jgi:hypothetical protein